MGYKNINQIKAIEKKNKDKLLALNSELNDRSGIYFLLRVDENGIRFAYIGQAKHILTRLAQHLAGYQYIDFSLKKHGLFSKENPHGWSIHFMNYNLSELDEMERHYITLYAQKGYQMRNKDTGGGAGKQELGERKEPKGYRDGLKQGRKNLAKELSHIIDKHLVVGLKPEKENNSISQKEFEKFNELLKGDES